MAYSIKSSTVMWEQVYNPTPRTAVWRNREEPTRYAITQQGVILRNDLTRRKAWEVAKRLRELYDLMA